MCKNFRCCSLCSCLTDYFLDLNLVDIHLVELRHLWSREISIRVNGFGFVSKELDPVFRYNRLAMKAVFYSLEFRELSDEVVNIREVFVNEPSKIWIQSRQSRAC